MTTKSAENERPKICNVYTGHFLSGVNGALYWITL